MTARDRGWVDQMLIDRRGDVHEANMTAVGLHGVVRQSEVYRSSTERGLVATTGQRDALDLEAAVAATRHDNPPIHAAVTATWGASDDNVTDGQNLLGDSVFFRLDGTAAEVQIPILEASSEALSYYGAILVSDGALVRFPAPDYPIWKMELGRRYIDGLLMTDNGTGFYLEYHHDRPHWHQPLTPDSGGYYILARPDSTRTNLYRLTGFRIPFGQAVYTGRGVIHCDAALTGKNWLVGYSDSDDFSTALVRSRDGIPVSLTGIDH